MPGTSAGVSFIALPVGCTAPIRGHSFKKNNSNSVGTLLQVEEYQGMLENSGLVGYAQEVLKETDQSCFVQTAKQLHIR